MIRAIFIFAAGFMTATALFVAVLVASAERGPSDTRSDPAEWRAYTRQ